MLEIVLVVTLLLIIKTKKGNKNETNNNRYKLEKITAIKDSGDIGDYFCGIKTQHQHIKV